MMFGAESVRHAGVGPMVLLCHGFTSSPAALAEWAGGLAEDGCEVDVPLLPGHGTSWQQLNRTGWPDWYARVERSLLQASPQRPVFVGGLSMGGALALRLAMQHRDRVAGLMLVNPAVILDDPRLRTLPVARRVIASLKGIGSDIARPDRVEQAYDRTPLHALASSLELFRLVEAGLPRVQAPVIVFRSLQDHVVTPKSPLRVLERIGSRDVTDVPLTRSFHVATMDYELDLIISASRAFVSRVAAEDGALA